VAQGTYFDSFHEAILDVQESRVAFLGNGLTRSKRDVLPGATYGGNVQRANESCLCDFMP